MEPSASPSSPQLAVAMRGIVKRFGPVTALDAVNFEAYQGEIHALVGENGAGKTTLMRLLYGGERPDSGTIQLFGRDVKLQSAAEGIAHGVGMVSQHYSVIPELTCIENLILGAEPGWAYSLETAIEKAQALAERMGFQFDWSAPAERLSPAGAQKLEILKLLWRQAQIMILDEPTAMLSPADSDALFDSLQNLATDGATVIVVTHRLSEALERCARITTLRGGKLVDAREVGSTTPAELAELIVGKSVDSSPRPTATPRAEKALEIDQLTALGYRGDEAIKAVSLTIRAGEMVGIAGVDGSGQRELFWTVMGLLRPTSGSARLLGEPLFELSVAERLRRGMRLTPEDRHAEGVVEEWSLIDNGLLGLQRRPEFLRGGWMDRSHATSHAAAIADRFKTKHGALTDPMRSLSGGNQQRFVAARALQSEPKLLLAFQPARGLDIEATRQVYAGIAEACANGAAALIVSYDLDELIDQCDRVVAMCGGRLFEPPPGFERDRATIGALMVAAP